MWGGEVGPIRGLGGHPRRQPQWINLQNDVVCAVRQADSLLLFIGGVDQACLFALISSSDTAVDQRNSYKLNAHVGA